MKDFLFFARETLPGTLKLDEEESRHCVQVLRHHEGDSVFATDGSGAEFSCRISHADKKETLLEVTGKVLHPQGPEQLIHIAIAPTKNIERLEWFLEKSVESGIGKVSLFISARSERKTVNPERLKKIMVTAMKQSGRFFLPELSSLMTLKDFMNLEKEETKFLASQHAPSFLSKLYKPGTPCMILIGPEGDFTEEELKAAASHQFAPCKLGEKRFRTETAALVACLNLHWLNGSL